LNKFNNIDEGGLFVSCYIACVEVIDVKIYIKIFLKSSVFFSGGSKKPGRGRLDPLLTDVDSFPQNLLRGESVSQHTYYYRAAWYADAVLR